MNATAERPDIDGPREHVRDAWESFPREDYQLLWDRLGELRPARREEAALVLVAAVASAPGVSLREALEGATSRETGHVRARAMCVLREDLDLSSQDVGTIFDRSSSSVRRVSAGYQARPGSAEELDTLRQLVEGYPRLGDDAAGLNGAAAGRAEPVRLTEWTGELANQAERAEFLEALRPALIRMAYPYHYGMDQLLAALDRLEEAAGKAYDGYRPRTGVDRCRYVVTLVDQEVERLQEAGALTRPRGKIRAIPDRPAQDGD